MNRSLSWIEPAEVSRRVFRATGRSPETPTASPSSENEAPSLVDLSAAVMPGDPAYPDAPRYTREDGLVRRIEIFSRWLDACAAPRGFYIADADGLPIHMEGVDESEVVTGVALARSLRPLRHLVGTERFNAITLQLEDGRILQTIWSETRVGRVGMGIEPQRPLHPSQLDEVARAVRGIFDNEAETS